MIRRLCVGSLPFVPAVAGILLSAPRFRAHEPLAGLAIVYGGILLMILAVFRLPGASVPK